jgi:homoserine O-acetyltransferase
MSDHEIHPLGNLRLQRGATLPDAQIAYKTFGALNADKSNVIVNPTWYSGQHQDNEWLIGPGKALDPERYFIIVPNLFGNGLSSSPSNTPAPHNGPRFPQATVYDNVRAQHRLLSERFGIGKIRLVVGYSMGAMQAFHWGALYPHLVERILPFCGAARCSRHNFVFLEGVKSALMADVAFKDGWYSEPPRKGLRAFARVYAGWALSQTFYRQELDIKALGFTSLEDFLVGFWEGLFLAKDANNLLAMLWTWQHGDISDNELYHGDFARALAAIRSKARIMPGQTDLYFPTEDSQIEVAHMPDAKLIPFPSVWGHLAGGPGLSPEDGKFLDAQINALLATA